MGLTTGAVTRVIDPLEQAGYVRRVPTLPTADGSSSSPSPRRWRRSRQRWPATARRAPPSSPRYSDAELAVINDFLTRMADVTRDEANALRDPPGPRSRSPSIRRPDRRPGARPTAVPVRRERAAGPRLVRLRRPLPRQVRRAGARRSVCATGTVTVQYKGRLQWDWRERRADVALNAGVPWDVEIIGGANKLQGKLGVVRRAVVRADRRCRSAPAHPGPADRCGTDPARRWFEPCSRSSARPASSPAPGCPVARRRRVRSPEARRDRRPQPCSRRPGPPQASDRYVIEVLGGTNRITVVEVERLTTLQRWSPPVSEIVSLVDIGVGGRTRARRRGTPGPRASRAVARGIVFAISAARLSGNGWHTVLHRSGFSSAPRR